MLSPSSNPSLCLMTSVALLVAAVTLSPAQVQVTIIASKDNTLYQDVNGALSNGAGEYLFVGSTIQGSIRRAIIAFDIAGNIPQTAVITSVTLTLTMSRTIAGAQQISLYSVLADWGEGTSDAGGNEGSGAPATTGDATWLHRFFSSSLWTNPGGDFTATPSATQTVSGIGVYTWGSTPQMVNDVQQWLNAPSSTAGWVLRGNESVGQTAKRFASKNNLVASVRPQLTVFYQQPVSVKEHTDAPRSCTLVQNFPNPFNPTTAVRYQLPVVSDVKLVVYDILGREVAVLVNERKAPGSYSAMFDGSRLASGVYFYRLAASDVFLTKKLILLK
jgi:hypothetical protein